MRPPTSVLIISITPKPAVELALIQPRMFCAEHVGLVDKAVLRPPRDRYEADDRKRPFCDRSLALGHVRSRVQSGGVLVTMKLTHAGHRPIERPA